MDGDGYIAMEAGGDDCDDLDFMTNPASLEICDEIDNNCDGVVDEDEAVNASPWFPDADGDGFGDATQTYWSCSQPDGYIEDRWDCDDDNPNIHPGTTLNMVDIPMAFMCEGTFEMGSPFGEIGRESHERVHTVGLTHSFHIGVTEITQARWMQSMDENPSESAEYCEGACPVETITWNAAADFANTLSEEIGLPLCYICMGEGREMTCDLGPDWESPYDCTGFRLPTEAEWEYAARAGEMNAFYNGGNLVHEDDFFYCDGDLVLDNKETLDSIAVYCGNSDYVVHPVGGKEPNAWGLYGMAGLVLEWAHDWYEPILYTEIDPIGGEGPGYAERVYRSSSFWFAPKHSRSADRGYIEPDSAWNRLGMRIAITHTQDLVQALQGGGPDDTGDPPDETGEPPQDTDEPDDTAETKVDDTAETKVEDTGETKKKTEDTGKGEDTETEPVDEP